MQRIAIFYPLICMLVVSCTTRAVHNAGRATGTVTSEQAESVGRIVTLAQNAVEKGPSDDLWRTAVAEATESLVLAGHTNLNEIKALVVERTKAQESKARELGRLRRERFVILMHAITAHAMEESPPIDSADRRKLDAQILELELKSFDCSFTLERDTLIKRCFKEAMEKASQPESQRAKP